MFYDYKVELYEKNGGKINDYGILVDEELTLVKTLKCDLQPSSREILKRTYGIDEVCTKRMFCDSDFEIKNNNLIKFKDEYYLIVSIVEWEDYYDIFLNKER